MQRSERKADADAALSLANKAREETIAIPL
jgi:hypothetical protein